MVDLDLGAHGDDVVDASPARDAILSQGAGSGTTDGNREWRLALVVVVASGVVRLFIAALTPVFPDETYYWEWSRRLAAGYYDHPPMIAWLIKFGALAAGDTALGVRLGAVLAGVAATFFTAAAARRLAGDRAALIAAMVLAVMPLSAAGLILATPDAPLLAAAAATVYALVRVFEFPPRSRKSTRWWSVAGFALGLAFCSKITAVLLPLAVFVALVSRPALRERLKEPGPYLATIIAVVVFLPVIVWNARHGWITLAFQLQHGLAGTSGSMLKRELDLLGGQIGLVSPILFALCVVAVAQSVRATPPVSPRHALFAVVAALLFAFFVYSATRRRVEANWPALAYIPAVLLLASYARSRSWDRWLRAGVVLGGALTVVTYVNAFVPILPVPARRDPAARAAGWNDLASAVERIHAARRPLSSYRTHVAADRYQEASALAFLLPEHPETYSLNLSGRANQYDLWPSFQQRAHPGDALILVLDDATGVHPTAQMLAPHFATLVEGPLVPLARNGDVVKNMRIWLLGQWRGTWPQAALRSRP